MRIRFVAKLGPSKTEIKDLPSATMVSFLPMEAIGTNGVIQTKESRSIAEVEQGYTYFRDGDIVIAKITPCFENGKGALVTGLEMGVGFGTTELVVVRPNPALVHGPFLAWLFASTTFRRRGEGVMYGAAGQKRIPEEFIKDYKIVLPEIEEQVALCGLLDAETSKIDILLEQQKRLLALLREKRHALITRAVTRGVGIHEEVPETEIPWWGEVPKHWKRFRIKRVLSSSDYGTSSALDAAEGVPVLRMSNLNDGQVEFTGLKYIRDISDDLLIRTGDLLYNRTNSADLVCQVGLVGELPYDAVSFASYLVRLRTNEEVLPAYLNYLLNTPSLLAFVRRLAFAAINQSNLNPTRYGEVLIRLPPVNEQREIVDHIDAESASVAKLHQQACSVIELLMERRTSFISSMLLDDEEGELAEMQEAA